MNQSFENLAVGVVGLAGLFVLVLILAPPIQEYLGRREHRQRMRDRSWLKEHTERKGHRDEP